MYHLEGIFPHLLHNLHVDISKDLLDFCYEQKKRDPVGVQISNFGGWQSKPFYNDNTIGHHLIENILSLTSEVFIQPPVLGNWWININKHGAYNSMHQHPGSHMSGVIWIQIPKDSGNLFFPNPDYFCKQKEINLTKPFLKQTEGYQIEPKEGDVVLFSSCLQHKVNPNLSDDERISISFNARFPED